MKIEQLKEQIENKTISNDLLILVSEKDDFVAQQYIHEIATIKSLPIKMVETIDELFISDNVFFEETDNSLNVLQIDTFDCERDDLPLLANTIIMCKGVKDSTKQLISEYICEIPTLTAQNIKEYIMSMCDGLSTEAVNWLYDITNGNIYRIQQEIDRLNLFNKDEQLFCLDKFIEDGLYDDLTNFNIFNLTNAIMKRDVQSVHDILAEIQNMDVDPFGLLTILYNSFKNLIKVQLTSNPTAESLGISPKQFSAIKYNNVGRFSTEGLNTIIEFLTNIDFRIKNGDLPTDILIEYIITTILSIK